MTVTDMSSLATLALRVVTEGFSVDLEFEISIARAFSVNRHVWHWCGRGWRMREEEGRIVLHHPGARIEVRLPGQESDELRSHLLRWGL